MGFARKMTDSAAMPMSWPATISQHFKKSGLVAFAGLTMVLAACSSGGSAGSGDDWITPGGDLGKSHHSTLADINSGNVDRLGLAWETTLDTKMANELPIIHRNPFLLAQLDPAVLYRGNQETSPYHHWAASQLDVGGNTAYKNNVLMDGVPQLVGAKGTYVPAMDAVSEVNVQQNAVDAEYGHSAGGVVSVQMKSGTNDWHGSAYYLGRNPALNARPNSRSSSRRKAATRPAVGCPVLRRCRSMPPRSAA